MSGKIPERTIDEIRDRTDILALIGKYVPLRKAGRNFVGLCPFHAEKTPSFSVNPEKGIFKCFGCGKGGNAITFLMEIEGMSFVEAVSELGEQCGIRIEPDNRRSDKGDDRSERLYAVNENAKKYFIENLKTPEARQAVDYLRSRGLDPETLRTFQIGYALPRWDGLLSHFRRMGTGQGLLIEAGLAIEGEKGTYDRFRDRVIFPIWDHKGKVVGFGGRIIGKGEPKYLNTPETEIYHKGEIFYGLNITREDIKKAGYVIIVEGYLDLISLFKAGIRNVAATLGTALTLHHFGTGRSGTFRIVKRYAREVVLFFDPDEAGVRAAERALDLFSEDMNARVAMLPAGQDPDDFIRNNDADAFRHVVDNAEDIYDFCLEQKLGRRDLTKSRERTAALDEAAQVIRIKKSSADRDRYIARVAERLGIRDQSVVEKVNSLLKKTVSRGKGIDAGEAASAEGFHVPAAEGRLFAIAANFPGVLTRAGLGEGCLALFEQEVIRDMVRRMDDAARDGRPISFAALLEGIDDQTIRERLIDLAMIDDDEIPDETRALEIAADCVRHLEKKDLERKSREITQEIKDGQSEEAVLGLLRKKMDYVKNLKR